MLSYEQARQVVIEQCTRRGVLRGRDSIPLSEALGRVLTEEVRADRDYPPFDRSTRDGYAVRAGDAAEGAVLACRGEIKAGDAPMAPALRAGECAEIMTGAPVPAAADAVAMIEYTERAAGQVRIRKAAQAGQNIVRRGSEIASGQAILVSGTRLGYAELALAAQVGATELRCTPRPMVAILTTGDELVEPGAAVAAHQIRNSNSVSLAAQVALAGGVVQKLGIAKDDRQTLREKLNAGLRADMLIASGGVSMGKYDLVEEVLRDLGAEFYFDAVAIRPGKPAVFGRCGDTMVFGLPGNPVSTMVTFELFVAPALDVLGGSAPRALPLFAAKLGAAINEKPGMTHFLPARVEWPADALGELPVATPVRWQGSGDTAAVTNANCYLVVRADVSRLQEGSPVTILLRKDFL